MVPSCDTGQEFFHFYILLFPYHSHAVRLLRGSKGVSGVVVPVVFAGKGVEVFLFLMYDVLQAFIDWCTAMAYLLQHSLKDNHITDHRIL